MASCVAVILHSGWVHDVCRGDCVVLISACARFKNSCDPVVVRPFCDTGATQGCCVGGSVDLDSTLSTEPAKEMVMIHVTNRGQAQEHNSQHVRGRRQDAWEVSEKRTTPFQCRSDEQWLAGSQILHRCCTGMRPTRLRNPRLAGKVSAHQTVSRRARRSFQPEPAAAGSTSNICKHIYRLSTKDQHHRSERVPQAKCSAEDIGWRTKGVGQSNQSPEHARTYSITQSQNTLK